VRRRIDPRAHIDCHRLRPLGERRHLRTLVVTPPVLRVRIGKLRALHALGPAQHEVSRPAILALPLGQRFARQPPQLRVCVALEARRDRLADLRSCVCVRVSELFGPTSARPAAKRARIADRVRRHAKRAHARGRSPAMRMRPCRSRRDFVDVAVYKAVRMLDHTSDCAEA
jgi:hypothetical protein